jgi:hypothetical protein
MGAIFKLEHANMMAYLTSRSFAAPRIRAIDLEKFLDVFIENPQQYLIPERGFEPWPEHISELASRAKSRLLEREAIFTQASDRRFLEGEVINGRTVEDLLAELRSEFSYYPLYALAIGKGSNLPDVADWLARQSLNGSLLVLIPEGRDSEYYTLLRSGRDSFSGLLTGRAASCRLVRSTNLFNSFIKHFMRASGDTAGTIHGQNLAFPETLTRSLGSGIGFINQDQGNACFT